MEEGSGRWRIPDAAPPALPRPPPSLASHVWALSEPDRHWVVFGSLDDLAARRIALHTELALVTELGRIDLVVSEHLVPVALAIGRHAGRGSIQCIDKNAVGRLTDVEVETGNACAELSGGNVGEGHHQG